MKELSEATLTTVMQVHNITRIQAQDMWIKVTSFSKILERKYVDTYMDNLDTIITLMQEYKQKVLDTYKKKHPKKPTSIEIEQEHRDAVQLDEWRRGNCSDEVRDYLDKNLQGWRVEQDFDTYVEQLFNIK